MKICARCGERNLNPQDKCIKCDKKFDQAPLNNPMIGHEEIAYDSNGRLHHSGKRISPLKTPNE